MFTLKDVETYTLGKYAWEVAKQMLIAHPEHAKSLRVWFMENQGSLIEDIADGIYDGYTEREWTEDALIALREYVQDNGEPVTLEYGAEMFWVADE